MNRLPLPPVPNGATAEMRSFLISVRSYLQVILTGLQDPGRRAVTFDDLVALGLVTQAQADAQAKVQA